MAQTLTIHRGDVFILEDDSTFRVHDAGLHHYRPGSTASMRFMSSMSVNIYRNPDPDPVTHKRGGPVLVYEGVKCTPIDDIQGGVHIDASMPPVELKRTYVDAGDVYYKVTLEQREAER